MGIFIASKIAKSALKTKKEAVKIKERETAIKERETDIEDRKIQFKEREAKIEKDKHDREQRAKFVEHSMKMEELEALQSPQLSVKPLNIDYDKAKEDIDYLLDTIVLLEKEKNSYRNKNIANQDKIVNNGSGDTSHKSRNPAIAEIVNLIRRYHIPDDRDDLIYAIERIGDAYSKENEYIFKAWNDKIQSVYFKCKDKYGRDKQVMLHAKRLKERLPKEEKKKAPWWLPLAIIGGSLAVGGIVAGIVALSKPKEPEVIPEALPGQTIFIEYDYSHFSGENYLDVQTYFTTQGFEDVRLNPLGDLVTGILSKENTVDSISINGDTKFKANRWYYPTDIVIISYHTFKNK